MSGNPLVIIINGTGTRIAESFNGSKAPELHVEFTTGGGGNLPPTVNITSTADGSNSTVGDSVSFAATADDPEDNDVSGSLVWTSSIDNQIGTGTSFTTTSLSEDTHIITATATDTPGLTGSDQITIIVNPVGGGNPGIVEKRVAPNSSDDAEEQKSTRMLLSLGSNDLELGFDRTRDQKVGLLFQDIVIPPGATITNATVQFQADELSDGNTATLTINGQLSPNPVTFDDVDSDISSSSRPLTAASVQWIPPDWTTVGEAGPAQRTPDIALIVQEIVDQQGWSSGNSLVIIISGTGTRTAESSNGDAQAAPLLHVEFTTP